MCVCVWVIECVCLCRWEPASKSVESKFLKKNTHHQNSRNWSCSPEARACLGVVVHGGAESGDEPTCPPPRWGEPSILCTSNMLQTGQAMARHFGFYSVHVKHVANGPSYFSQSDARHTGRLKATNRSAQDIQSVSRRRVKAETSATPEVVTDMHTRATD